MIKTIGELKAILNQYPDDMYVVTPGQDECGLQFLDVDHVDVLFENDRPMCEDCGEPIEEIYSRLGPGEYTSHPALMIAWY